MWEKGDILLDFRKRRIFMFTTRSIFDAFMIPANAKEIAIFKKQFIAKGVLLTSFSEFKKYVPDFNSKSYKNRVYGYIPIDADLFVRLKKYRQHPPFTSCKSDLDIIYALMNFYEVNKISQKIDTAKKESLAAIDEIQQILVKLKKYIV